MAFVFRHFPLAAKHPRAEAAGGRLTDDVGILLGRGRIYAALGKDTTLVLADGVPLPNFPSYPSGHACSAGAFDAVMGHFFPKERAEFTRIAEEQAMSRLYGGIHYRFDNDGGLALGRIVARYDVEQERRGRLSGSVIVCRGVAVI